VGKPQFIEAKHISEKLKQSWKADFDSAVKIVDLKPKFKVSV
jgi:hypothetical protein